MVSSLHAKKGAGISAFSKGLKIDFLIDANYEDPKLILII